MKLPCDKGDGRAGRGLAVDGDVTAGPDDAVADVVVVVDDGGEGEIPVGRVAEFVDEDDEPL